MKYILYFLVAVFSYIGSLVLIAPFTSGSWHGFVIAFFVMIAMEIGLDCAIGDKR